MLETYESEQRGLKERSEALQVAVSHAEEAYSNVENFVNLIQKHTDIQELDAHILNSLIDKIVVHEKETHEDGGISQRVDIHYKFIGYLPLGEILAGSNSINGINRIKRLAAFKNLKFYKAQAMRMSTYDKERIICPY